MMTIFTDGGFSMFFILAFGVVALGWAAWFAARRQAKPLGFVKGMMAATLFATLTGFASDLGTTFKAVAGVKEHQFEILLEGMGESMAPGIMGFTMLALTALLVAVGTARVEAAAG